MLVNQDKDRTLVGHGRLISTSQVDAASIIFNDN